MVVCRLPMRHPHQPLHRLPRPRLNCRPSPRFRPRTRLRIRSLLLRLPQRTPAVWAMPPSVSSSLKPARLLPRTIPASSANSDLHFALFGNGLRNEAVFFGQPQLAASTHLNTTLEPCAVVACRVLESRLHQRRLHMNRIYWMLGITLVMGVMLGSIGSRSLRAQENLR